MILEKENAEDQALFLKELKTLEIDLCESDETIYIDSVYPQHNFKPSYGWFKKRRKGVKPTTLK